MFNGIWIVQNILNVMELNSLSQYHKTIEYDGIFLTVKIMGNKKVKRGVCLQPTHQPQLMAGWIYHIIQLIKFSLYDLRPWTWVIASSRTSVLP